MGWRVRGLPGVRRLGTAPRTTPAGPGRSLWALPVLGPLKCRLWAIGRDSMTFLRKVVKTTKCHQKVSKRPRLVPVSQNGSKKSPLEILRFPLWRAFSHKELMGHFDASTGIIVKMTKCRQVAHTCSGSRRGRRYPHGVGAASCPYRHRSSSAQREQTSDILNGPGIDRFTGDYD